MERRGNWFIKATITSRGKAKACLSADAKIASAPITRVFTRIRPAVKGKHSEVFLSEWSELEERRSSNGVLRQGVLDKAQVAVYRLR